MGFLRAQPVEIQAMHTLCWTVLAASHLLQFVKVSTLQPPQYTDRQLVSVGGVGGGGTFGGTFFGTHVLPTFMFGGVYCMFGMFHISSTMLHSNDTNTKYLAHTKYHTHLYPTCYFHTSNMPICIRYAIFLLATCPGNVTGVSVDSFLCHAALP